MRNNYLLCTLALALLCGSASYSQDFSNKGKDFWVAYGYHQVMSPGQGNSQEMRLYFSAEQLTNVTVTIPGVGYTQNYVVPANTTIAANPIPKGGAQDARLTGESAAPENKGIHITSDKPIVAYAHIYNGSVSGATILFPTNTLGKDYYSVNYKNISNTTNANSWVYVIATDPGTTTVEITPSANTINHTGGTPFQVNLTQGQVYNLMGQLINTAGPTFTGEDLTGTRIQSINTGSGCKRIAVFSGSGRISITCDASSSSSDNYMVQAFPKTAWGRKFLTVPSIEYNATAGGSFSRSAPNLYRVCVSDPAAVVSVNGVPLSAALLVNNFYYELAATSQPMSVVSDLPILVAQYFPSRGACGQPAAPGGGDGDPEVIYLSPVEQNINKVLWNANAQAAINQQKHYINVVIPNAGTAISSFTLDGAPVPASSFIVHPQDPAYSYVRLNVTSTPGGGANVGLPHIVQSDSGFNAIAYGYGSAESYGYNAGTNIKDIFRFLSVQNQFATVNFPATCKNTPFYLSMVFPYEPTQIQWIFGPALNALGFTDITLNNPVFDSSWVVSGRTLYRYKILTPYSINTPGTYPIRVQASNPTPDGCGGIQEIDFDLQVFDNPVADFNFATNGCLTEPVSFTTNPQNLGGRTVASWFWDFGEAGATATTANTTHTYSAPGSFTVKHVIITDVGCISDTLPKVVNLTNPPVAGMTASNTRCVGKPVTFSDASTVPAGSSLVEWTWNFGDGSPLVVATNNADQVHTYAAAGNYIARLRVKTATGCFSTEFQFPITIHVNPVVNFTFPNICLPAGAAQFTNTTTISDGTQALLTYNWDFGDGSPNVATVSPLHIYAGTGPYTATLTATSNNGCTENLPRIVNTIYAQPDGEFTVNPENCIGAVTSFTSTSNPLAGNTVSQWHWEFGDATPNSSVQNPVHTYAAAGTYTVRHWIVTDKGCNSDTAVHTVTVNPLPTAAFNFTGPACETRVLSFTDNSTANAGILNNWTWNFGDGSPVSAVQNPTHTYALPGTYNVTLQVTNDKGCVSTVHTGQVTVSRLPQALFTFPESCQDDAVQFTDGSSVTGGSITQWTWNFGDATALSNLQNPQHNYAAPGVYTVTLTATTNNGCSASSSASVTVNGDTPVADFVTLNAGSLCSSDSISIQDISTVNFGSVTRIEIYWDNAGAPTVFDTDDLPASGKIYKHKYPTLQTTQSYVIRYRAYSGVTCVDDRIRPITVNATPKVQFNAIPDICLDAAAYQITQASETGGVAGTGVFSGPGVSPTGLFDPSIAGPGTHTIKFTYTATAAGCVDSLSRTIKVLAPPITDFSIASPVCETKPVTFTSTSTSAEGSLTTWTWNFGDGSPVVIRNNPAALSHTYAAYGPYDVTLTVLTSDGCSAAPKVVRLNVNPQPKANFTLPASACLPNANISPLSTSSIADGSQASFSYLWNFGDPGSGTVNTSTAANPTHTYVTTGPFDIKLEITSGAGCKHDTTITLSTIHPQPIAAFNTDKVDVCIGGSFTFSDNSNPLDGTITQWNWVLDDGNTRDVPGFTYTYSTARVYNVSLFIFNSHGCRSTTATKAMSVNPYPGVSAGPDKVVLEGGEVMLTPSQNAGPNVTYLWAPPTGLNDPTSGFPLASPAADITYTLTVTTDKGCSASDQVFVKVLKSPAIPNIFSPNGDGVHDKWIIQYLDTYPGCTVDIFNRYGQVVFHSVGYTTPWDGTVNGKPVPVGTYYYIVNPKNGRKQMTGYLDVIR